MYNFDINRFFSLEMSQFNANRRSFQPPVLNEESDDEDVNINMNNWSMPTNKRSSLYSMNNPNSSNQSLNIPKRQHHRRQSSMAADNYTPQQLLPLPPSSQPNSANQQNSPFKFGSMSMNASSESLNLPKASYRRGHRYKHSSVSMNLFQEAPDAVVKNTPKTYSVPTFKDIKESINSDQAFKIGVCIIQLTVLTFTYILGIRIGWGCLITLSHVLFYDLISNGLIVIVQVMANFPIWKMSSLNYPFGLGRIEVLSSFGLSVSLLFVGLDLLSHIIEELVMEVISIDESGGLENHVHSHGSGDREALGMNIFVYELLIILIIAVSLFTSHTVNLIPGRGRMQAEELSVVKRLSSITLNTPSHKPLYVRVLNSMGFSIDDSNGKRNIMSSSTTLLTFIYSIYCMVYPMVNNEMVNELSTVGLSILILWIGSVLIKRYAYTLLLGTQLDSTEEDIRRMITSLDSYKSNYKINEVKVSRVNHKVWVIIIDMEMRGADDDEEAKIRFYANRVVTGVMTRAVNDEIVQLTGEKEKNYRGDLLDIMTSTEGGQMNNTCSSSQFEITIDCTRR